MIALLLFLIAIPFYLVVGLIVIGGSFLLEILPTLIALYFVLAVLSILFTPLKPWFKRNIEQIQSVGQWIAFFLFAPLFVLILLAIIALPFILIYAIAENPFVWYGAFALIFAILGIYIYNNYDAIQAEIRSKEEEKILKKMRERAEMHQYFYSERE
ncbi:MULTISPECIES: hypothetical protein [unclassified Pasteurella]|uniref:hypothetical protein n=1 Tax=unclassified Pasteurella TaxID=2621516 RepID=UPI0010743C02|nr:hypothetical protein [Pasteurella sp. 19428wF3_WM03]TFU51222.1 hypothetical protein E4T92_05290 [Pasteurella sp. WM03]